MKHLSRLKKIDVRKSPIPSYGRVRRVVGQLIEADGPAASLGTRCFIRCTHKILRAEVVGFTDNKVMLMAFDNYEGVTIGDRVYVEHSDTRILVGEQLLGRVISGLGEPLDELGPIENGFRRDIYSSSPPALTRKPINEVVHTGVRAIDGLLTIGTGQRIGLFAGSGVGKSVLLGMIARYTDADINVIALIGERGREVREFLERDLGPEGMARSVVVVSTSDTSPLERRMAPFVATTIAEYFADQGKRVLLMMDSLTRYALAQREIGLAIGEPPTTKGFTPSVFSGFPKLLERAGNTSSEGSITGFYTVLVEGDDVNDPVSDTVRSIIDGHIVLDRNIAAQNHYPAINILYSASRLMRDLVDENHNLAASQMRSLMAAYSNAEDLINIGAYVKGSNPKIDEALLKIDGINGYLKQDINEKCSFEETINRLRAIAG